MPYYITDRHPECANWSVVKEDGELVACHDTKDDAVENMVAVSIAEDIDPAGEYEGQSFRSALGGDKYTTSEEASARAEEIGCAGYHSMTEDGRTIYMPCDSHSAYENIVGSASYRAEPDELQLGDFVRWNSSGGTAQGRIEHIMTEGVLGVPDSSFSINASEDDPAALIRIYREDEEDGWQETETLVGHRFSTLTKIDSLIRSEQRDVNLVAPAYMRASARQGLKYYEEGLAGDGLVDRTVTEARQMARGDALTPDKWVRISAWIARHLVDLDAPDADPQADGYPSAGVVAHLLWGSGPSKRAARRAMEYAEGVVARIEAENSERTRTKGEVVKKLELRTNKTEFEVRDLEDGGMSFSGYASVFNSRSENLGGFTEVVAPGAFSRSLKSRNNMFLLYDHNPANVLASTRAGTMRLTEDSHGLYVEADIAPTSLGKDMATLIRRGDLDSMSFGFSVIRDSWNDAGDERTLHAVRLAEVSVVASPAYVATAGTVAVRGLSKIAKRAGVDSDELADVLLKLEEGANMTLEEVDLLSKVVNELNPESGSVEEEVKSDAGEEVDFVALKKQKLKLLEMLSNG